MKDIITFSSLSKIKGLVHGFSTKSLGSMSRDLSKDSVDITPLAKRLNVSMEDVIGMDQVHGTQIYMVGNMDTTHTMGKTDGLITKDKSTFLYGTFADCVPIFLVDPKTRFVGIIHSGFRGTLDNIVGKTMQLLKKNGVDPKRIRVGIGPSIRNCCYSILPERALLFSETFPLWQKKILTKKGRKIYLSLQKIVMLQLIEEGIQKKNIEEKQLCTSCKKTMFFSFRRTHTKEGYTHKQAGIIGWR